MEFKISKEMEAFIRKLPKTETHLHVEGALPFELIQGIHPEKYTTVPDSWDLNFKFRDFEHFESELLSYAADWFHSPERYYEATKLMFERMQKEQNVKYVSCSFASGCLEHFGSDGRETAEAIKAAVPEGMKLDLFMGIHHPGYTEVSKRFIEASLNWKALDGYDLHGVETLPVEDWTPDFWKRARDHGKYTKAHAGEFCGPDFIARVIQDLGVTRIQHGVRALESDTFVQRLREEDIVLDVCPISNYKLGLVDSYDLHKGMPLLRDENICCTISTDDPVSFGNTLYDEYAFLVDHHNFDAKNLGRLAKNGFRTSTLAKEEIEKYCSEIDELVAANS